MCAQQFQARLDDRSRKRLAVLVRELGWTPSQVVREGLRVLLASYLRRKRRGIIGLGKFLSGVPDLGSNKKHLRRFGREDAGRMKHLRLTRLGHVAASALIVAAASLSATVSDGQGPKFNHPGNIRITDQFNNRVIEIDPAGNIVWQFPLSGGGPSNVSSTAIVGTNDAERVGGLTLMSGTGIPAGASPACPSTCVDNRVLLVNHHGKIVWQYGTFGVTDAGPNQLNTPVQNTYLTLSNGEAHVLITDQDNNRIIEVRVPDKQIVWEYDGLNNPNAAELLANGNVLISDENNSQALEVTHAYGSPSSIVHTYTQAGGVMFSFVAFASRLPNGHTLITDSGNSHIVETDEAGDVFWQFSTNTRPGSNASPLPTRAVRLANGDTLISDQFNHQVIIVDMSLPDVMSGVVVKSYGTINAPGFKLTNASVMNGPYSAYVIGDYTGLTPPF
jgi:outer membrane protein assembly factor BamB